MHIHKKSVWSAEKFQVLIFNDNYSLPAGGQRGYYYQTRECFKCGMIWRRKIIA